MFIDRWSSLPPYVQLKEQIKMAFTFGRLRQGDPLPSIRVLARKVGVREGVVRRAYRELQELGILSTERRKHVIISQRLASPPPALDALTETTMVECDRLLDWAREKGLSSIAMARLLRRRALTRELADPSYAYVDASKVPAVEFASFISRSWEVTVAPLTLLEMERLPREQVDRFVAILVNSYRQEELYQLIERRERVFPVRLRIKDRILRRIRRLPAGSSVLLVLSDGDFQRVGRPAVESYQARVGSRWNFEAEAFGRIPDMSALAANGHYRLIIVSVHLWDEVPEAAKQSPIVIANQNEPDSESLEEIRIPAGVLV